MVHKGCGLASLALANRVVASTSLRSLKRGPLVGQRLRRSKILMTLLIKRASVSAVGSLFQRELPTGVRDSVESAAGRSTSRPRFGKASAFPKPQPGRASEAAPDPQPLAPSIRVAERPATHQLDKLKLAASSYYDSIQPAVGFILQIEYNKCIEIHRCIFSRREKGILPWISRSDISKKTFPFM